MRTGMCWQRGKADAAEEGFDRDTGRAWRHGDKRKRWQQKGGKGEVAAMSGRGNGEGEGARGLKTLGGMDEFENATKGEEKRGEKEGKKEKGEGRGEEW